MRRQDVQRAAVRLFARKGFAATGIRELGTAVGINSATLYHYAGGGKEELLVTIMRTCLDELLRGGRAAVASSDDPTLQLGALIASHVGISAVNPMTAQVTDQEMRSLSPENRRALVALRDDYESMLGAVLERGVRTGAFHVTDVHLARLAILEMCNGVAHWFRPDGRSSVADVQARFVEFGCRVVGAVPGHEPHALPPPIRLDIEPADADREEATA
ncbi:TetR family transcriptional regulator [Actinomadura sp. NBRC 104412]|uniref:TetR/AcrR family transcriptional regulator n=1 Tax=Actinomadura sp. NBRC 104412 TaxID=3032203 RepID=UPI0024A3E3FE|nr:TetR/AcrR family transcriptional regulator [Actinomadura sp. NBRC 104412]GLZ09268.1 TetR family transcriptional regulator [Actinomadura sp. NBRC 104412]